MKTRAAAHANSWYSSDGEELARQLDGWLDTVGPAVDRKPVPIERACIIIAPHAGYSYSGQAAAWAYKSLDLTNIKRIFILGPSHHVYLDSCALSSCTHYATPLGTLPLDTETLKALHSTGLFQWMRQSVDEDEHSIEMQLPYLYRTISAQSALDRISLVPIMVGGISSRKEKAYGEALAPYLSDPENAFVVSSDFCHWGTRFQYQHYFSRRPTKDEPLPPVTSPRSAKGSDLPIYESVEILDKKGIEAIETGRHDAFVEYLSMTNNTICGRHPIGVIMAGLETVLGVGKVDDGKGRFKFVRYEQSSKCIDTRDSSVSYASAYAVLKI